MLTDTFIDMCTDTFTDTLTDTFIDMPTDTFTDRLTDIFIDCALTLSLTHSLS